MASAAWFAAASVAFGDRAGEDVRGTGDGGELAGDLAGFVALRGLKSHWC